MLKYDINAFCMIEELSGKSVLDIVGNPEQLTKFAMVRLVFWAGLLHESPKITLSEAGDKIQNLLQSGKTFGDVASMISEGILSSGLVEKAESQGEDPANPPSA